MLVIWARDSSVWHLRYLSPCDKLGIFRGEAGGRSTTRCVSPLAELGAPQPGLCPRAGRCLWPARPRWHCCRGMGAAQPLLPSCVAAQPPAETLGEVPASQEPGLTAVRCVCDLFWTALHAYTIYWTWSTDLAVTVIWYLGFLYNWLIQASREMWCCISFGSVGDLTTEMLGHDC